MGHYQKQSECGSYNYLLYLPEGYEAASTSTTTVTADRRPEAGWPLLLFLHGADRKGVRLDTLRTAGIPRLCEERLVADSEDKSDVVDVETGDDHGHDGDADSPRTAAAGFHLRRAAALAQRSPHRRTPSAGAAGMAPLQMQAFPFVVVSPLCPLFKYWRVESLASLLEEVTEQYHVDPRRVYAVGEGMGGWAVCALAARVPRCLAACVPIAAATDPSLIDVDQLTDTPLWIFHGSDDADAHVADVLEEPELVADGATPDNGDGLRASMRLAQALRRRGARSVLFTTYPTTTTTTMTADSSTATTKDFTNADPLPGVSVVGGGGASDQNELVKRAYTYDNPLLYQWLLQHSLPLLDV
jgi:pimeloyl-ACP methyl ester carboxylesterase